MNQGLLVTKAIQSLCPDAQFSILDYDLNSISWIAGTNIPTPQQIEVEIENIKLAETQAEAEAVAKKAAAEAKLAALGLTADDLKALGLGGN